MVGTATNREQIVIYGPENRLSTWAVQVLCGYTVHVAEISALILAFGTFFGCGVIHPNMATDGDDTETVQVKTRVPAYQREAWREAADRRGMSQSEFVRTMVQAGRSGLEGGASAGGTSSPEETTPPGSNPRGKGLESRVRSTLSDADEAVSWEGLVEALVGDFEERLEETLQSSDRVRYSGREGGYVLTDE